MTIDPYALCPCGNGKKIKFCKCKDSLPELDRVMTMIEGRQIVPALDRLNQVLSEHPDAAWALAIKGRLMIDLREYDSLAENSERFVRLQPSNPLALAQRGAAELFRQNFSAATLSLLEALTESGRSVDSFVLDIASLLAYSLASSGSYLTARSYVQLPLTAQGYDGNQTATMVYQELNSSTEINQLFKTVPQIIPREANVPWAERFDEAIGLLQTNQVLLAESKLQSLARTVPREPCVLTGQLTCAIWRGDIAEQAACLRRLSECESLSHDERVKYLALCWLVEPNQPMISVESTGWSADIADVEQAEMAMRADSSFAAIDPQMLAEMVDESVEIRPRSGFQVIDRPMPEPGTIPTVDTMPRCKAVVFVFGKQTDRAARIEIIHLRKPDHDAVKQTITSALGELTWVEVMTHKISLVEAIAPVPVMLDVKLDRKAMLDVQGDVLTMEMRSSLLSMPLKCFGDRGLTDAASDSSTLVARAAYVRVIEGYEAIASQIPGLIAELYAAANVTALPTLKPKTVEELRVYEPIDLGRVDVSELDAEGLIFAFQQAKFYGVDSAIALVSRRLLEIDLEPSLYEARMMAYMALIERAENPDEALTLINKGKAFASVHKLDQASLRILELTQRLMSGDSVAFTETLRGIAADYNDRPEVMARVQRLLISVGIMRPDGTLRDRPAGAGAADNRAAPAGGSGLWTPGGDSPAPAGAAASGGSKLWVPGMD